MQKLVLSGHSGCKLEVEKHGSEYVVIKTSKNVAYNPRLQKQYEKQKAFKSDIFRTPKILDSHYDTSGLFTFSMEYINGFTLSEYLKRASPAEIKAIAKQFSNFIPKKRATDPGAAAQFAAKLGELKQPIHKSGQKSTKEAFMRLQTHEWKYAISSYCHGDLTLENVIWKDGELYLIDFLDSFYDSWMLDTAKLVFDLECRWSYRYETEADENLNARLAIFKNSVLEHLDSLPNAKPRVREIYHMALLHALRILPYTTDRRTKKYLHDSISKLHALLD